MKKIFIILCAGSMPFLSIGQNVFPTPSGNVGIGTASPANLLDVFISTPISNTVGSSAEVARFSALSTGPNLMQMKLLHRRHTLDGGWTSISSRLQMVTDVTFQGYLEFNPQGDPYGLAIGTADNVELMRFKQNGSIGIGTINPGPYKLAVEGAIGARKVKVTTASPWADYVFEANYKLPSLQELETFIRTNKHLPEVPTATEVAKDGLDLGDNQATLLKKIEELTLYVIEQNKKLEAQNRKLDDQQKTQASQDQQLQELSEQVKRLQEENKQLRNK